MSSSLSYQKTDRFKGALIGLATGDGLSVTLEFSHPGTLPAEHLTAHPNDFSFTHQA